MHFRRGEMYQRKYKRTGGGSALASLGDVLDPTSVSDVCAFCFKESGDAALDYQCQRGDGLIWCVASAHAHSTNFSFFSLSSTSIAGGGAYCISLGELKFCYRTK